MERHITRQNFTLCHLPPQSMHSILNAPAGALETLRGSHSTSEKFHFWHLQKAMGDLFGRLLWQFANSRGDGTPQEMAPF